jgi:Ca2+-binding EF-hand superfamily protein
MIQKDYIMRMIEQFAAILIKIMFNKETQNYTQALFEIDTAYKTFLNFDPDHIKAISEDELVSMLKSSGSIDAEKCIIVAELL